MMPKDLTLPCTVLGSHHRRDAVHWTIWFKGSVLNTKSDCTDWVDEKQLESEESTTVAAELVPPLPKLALSLT